MAGQRRGRPGGPGGPRRPRPPGPSGRPGTLAGALGRAFSRGDPPEDDEHLPHFCQQRPCPAPHAALPSF
ncbi:hypothetical protein E2651_40725 [Streptomyces sp. MZ04]|nr:hypothetical protein E2651_40725 [Streptomyces sp. MZ04]